MIVRNGTRGFLAVNVSKLVWKDLVVARTGRCFLSSDRLLCIPPSASFDVPIHLNIVYLLSAARSIRTSNDHDHDAGEIVRLSLQMAPSKAMPDTSHRQVTIPITARSLPRAGGYKCNHHHTANTYNSYFLVL